METNPPRQIFFLHVQLVIFGRKFVNVRGKAVKAMPKLIGIIRPHKTFKELVWFLTPSPQQKELMENIIFFSSFLLKSSQNSASYSFSVLEVGNGSVVDRHRLDAHTDPISI